MAVLEFAPNVMNCKVCGVQCTSLGRFGHWENAVDLLKMSQVILSSVSEEFQGNLTVLLEISDKDPLYSHCYQVKY